MGEPAPRPRTSVATLPPVPSATRTKDAWGRAAALVRAEAQRAKGRPPSKVSSRNSVLSFGRSLSLLGDVGGIDRTTTLASRPSVVQHVSPGEDVPVFHAVHEADARAGGPCG